MKSILTFAAVVAMMGVSTDAQAHLIGRQSITCGGEKCCDCAPTFQPIRCKPTIVRPCHRNVYNYQRTCAKPMCYGDACGNGGCCPVNGGAGNGCLTGAGAGCVDPNACVGNNGNACVGGAGAACVDPNACVGNNGNACVGNNGNGCLTGAGAGCVDPNACCHTNGNSCLAGDDGCCSVGCKDACKIAELIYESQTACYAKDRAAAIHRLGDKYDCVCHPEIMSAFIYALNDSDERVRSKAADEIGDQIRRNSCCCSQCVVSALCNALADCDRKVRREAEQALRLCGYHIVNGCCKPIKDTCVAMDPGCCHNGNACAPAGCAPAGAPAAIPAAPAAPMEAAPAPPAEPKAYFPGKVSGQISSRRSLSNLFGLVD
jgi:hypothetical protein